MLNILLVEDNKKVRRELTTLFQRNRHKVIQCQNGKEAVSKMDTLVFDLIITDLKMEPGDGFAVLKAAQTLQPEAEVIVITAVGSIEDGVKAMKIGAFDFMEKPVSHERLLRLTKYIEEKRDLERELSTLRGELQGKHDFEAIIGKSKPMMNVLKMVSQVSQTDTTVLISGESGTGKELVARAVHTNSHRRENQMIAVNCGALPESLQESELFGHAKGSFTGAIREKKGLFEEAHNGTLFLDEIGEMSLSAQVKLLRFLQDGEIRKVGDNRPIQVDVRLIAATNKDLEEEVYNNKFREDLFYRLSVIPISIPALRERRDDIPLLIDHFLTKYSKKLDKESKTVSNKTMRILQNYDWPGNVRELENAIERAIVLTNGPEILPAALPDRITHRKRTLTSSQLYVGLTLAEVEKRYILRTMQDCDDDLKKASFRLGVTDNFLKSKLRDYDMLPASLISPTGQFTEREMWDYPGEEMGPSTKRGLSTILADNGISLSELERRYIVKVLARHTGNKRDAADFLGISTVTLWRKLKEFGIAKAKYEKGNKFEQQKKIAKIDSSVDGDVESQISEYLETAVAQGYSLKDIEQQHLLDTLQVVRGKKKDTAFRLGISKATLWRKLKELEPQTTEDE